MLGLVALALWSTSTGVGRSATAKLGSATAGALNYLCSGAILLAYLALRGRLRTPAHHSRRFLAGCGFLFVSYSAMLYLGLGWSTSDSQALLVAMLNYLWPTMILVFAVPILGKRPGPLLGLGIAAACAGIYLTFLSRGQVRFEGAWFPYLAGIYAAVSWGLFSNLSRLWGGADDNSLPLVGFMLATGVALGGLRLVLKEDSLWSPAALGEMAWMALSTSSAYLFWQLALARGNIVLLGAAGNLVPLLAALIFCLYNGMEISLLLWSGCALIILGAVLCSRSLKDPLRGPVTGDQEPVTKEM